ncbi:MAG TPA: glycoside hydrolase family 2 protein, partial [Sphingomicrobium sp.]|nr:glycoside hydrolase family 2 protein [Sphingomicrobium sp.]
MRWILALAALIATPALAAPKTTLSLNQGWQVRIDPADAQAAQEHPRAASWLNATVPGSVQQDLIAAGIVPDPFIGKNEAPIQWAGLTRWEYRTIIEVSPALLPRDHLDLVFDGLDTFATVLVNGTPLLSADNAHRRWRADAKPLLRAGRNELTVRFASPIKTLQPMVLTEKHPLPGEYDSAFGDEPKGKQTSPYIRKPKYQYGWDWAPRIVTIGLWKPARIEAWDDARIDALRIEQEALNDAEARLLARASIFGDQAERAKVRVDVTGPDGKRQRVIRDVVLAPGTNEVAVPVTIARPQRWQPVGHGAQPLYTVTATLIENGRDSDSVSRRTGLRTVELVRKDGSFGLKVNGIEIFAKGANLIPFDMFPARVTSAQQRHVLQSAVAANMNMVRVWGGGYYPDEAFYDIADELGLMIWQDFMFGGAITPPDAKFRHNVAIEAEEQVARLQAHPSLVIWAGNNEVQSGWQNWGDRIAFKKAVGPDEQERIGTNMAVLFDRVLREAVTRNDNDVPYWPGSPSTDYEGPIDTAKDGDRHFWDVWSGSKPIERYTDECSRFMSEYGFQAMPGLPTIAAFAGPSDLSPDSPVMKAHQKFLSGEGNTRLRFYLDQYQRKPRDFADFVYLTQVMQAQAIELAARHHRACRPVTLGSLYWQLNDTWPAISWASIDWFGRWKLLHYAARRFFAPQIIVAERKGEATRIALVSDATTPLPAEWRVRTFDMKGAMLNERRGTATLAPLSAADVATLTDQKLFANAAPNESYGVAELLVGGRAISRSIVERRAPKDMAYPAPGLIPRWQGKTLTLTATNLARAVYIGFGTLAAQPSDNGFDLLPGES